MKRFVTLLLIVLVMACICYVPAHASDTFQRQQQTAICESLAELTVAIAQARDGGISLADELAIVNSSPDADVREDGLLVVHFVWDRPHTAPDWIGQAMLLRCVSAIK